ncbi:MAG: hypothetical protein AAEJ47_07045 [Planctomycetota bacterium]
MRTPAGIFVVLVGLLLLVVVVRAYFEFMQLAASPTGIDLSFPTKAMLIFVPAVDLAAGSALSPSDLAAMINRIVLGFGSLGFILLLCGGYLLLMGPKSDGEHTVT